MRTAILSDIHGNAIALRAVVEELDADGIGRVVCLGDVCQGGHARATFAMFWFATWLAWPSPTRNEYQSSPITGRDKLQP